ncbi:MAG: DNA gyrase subunit A [Candidatus Chaera renei]|uniref:DNA gyrase subunit A n=1 Tax=Candidatus Chaera renei TaxID=2506947 RepID=A0A4Q0AIN0_9BACT|nr:MAG: DNA gyrase subunit A [Candidatus Chaera renei]
MSSQSVEKEISPDNLPHQHSRSLELRTVEDVMEDSFLRYSMSVIIERALPDVRDGLKPVHRRILYSMDKNNWRPGTRFVKSARITGDVMGKYHPHGDAAIYDSMVRMAQNWSMRYLLVDGQGNFGSMDGDPPAAQRYTEARMARAGAELLADLDKNTVDFRDNYDGSEQEPTVLPAKLPNLLLNGQMGIAVGMATNIPPHNLSELIDAIVWMIDNPDKITLDSLLHHIKGPDFPTGGIVYGGESLRQAYATGRGSITVRAVANIEETKKGRFQIVVTEMPFAVNKASVVERIADLYKEKKITGISDLRDESAREKTRLVIELRKDAYPKKVLNQLYKLTSLQTSFHYNMLALVDGLQPRVLGLEDILSEYLKHRQTVVRRRTEFELVKARDRAHILEGWQIALDNIDAVIRIIRSSQTVDEAAANLIKAFKLTDIQARSILALPLRTLTGLERQKIDEELASLNKLIAELESILASEEKILGVIRQELISMKEKYGDERRTQIIAQDLGKFSDEELIPDEYVAVVLTTENYIKRTLVSEYRRQHRGGKGKKGIVTKEDDIIDQLVTANTHDWLLFFTNKGRVFRLKVYEVPAAGLSARGIAVVNLLQLQPEEHVTSIVRVEKNHDQSGYLLMATTHGVVKKTHITNYQNIRTTGLIAIKLDDGDELKWIKMSSGDDEVVISTAYGQAIRFKEGDTRSMGRAARGVRGIRLRKGDMVVGMDLVHQDKQLLVLSEKGYGKLTKLSNFPTHKRGGFGIRAAVVNGKTGNLVTVRALDPEATEVLIISHQGQAIRIALDDIPVLGRNTQGVRVMRLAPTDSVASLGLLLEATAAEELAAGEEVVI